MKGKFAKLRKLTLEVIMTDGQKLVAFLDRMMGHYDGDGCSSNQQNAADPPVGGAAEIGDESGGPAPSRAGR